MTASQRLLTTSADAERRCERYAGELRAARAETDRQAEAARAAAARVAEMEGAHPQAALAKNIAAPMLSLQAVLRALGTHTL